VVIENAYQEIFNLTYHGRFDSEHCAKMTVVERRKFHAMLVDAKNAEQASAEKTSSEARVPRQPQSRR